jgi:hypothetical protein
MNWTKVGADHINREQAAAAIDRLVWLDLSIPENRTQGMMPAMGISECIKQLHIPHVSHIAISSDLAPCGLYGIRGRYTNGIGEVFILDEGTDCIPIASRLLVAEAA